MTKTTKPAGEKKTRAPRKEKTAADLQAEIAATKKKLQLLEAQTHSVEINDQINKSNIAATYKSIKGNLKKVSDLAILTAVVKAAGIKRIEITEKPAATRKKKAA